MTNSVVAIFGPTASGKSAVAVALAQAIDGEIVSADSMQIYRGLERLTNQPTTAEQGGIPHHLVGHVEPTVSYDVSRFAADAHAAIDGVIARDRTPIVVGGSGLYLRAALADVEFPPHVDPDERARIAAEVERLGPADAHAWLRREDAEAAARIAPTDTRRVVRALELASVGESLAPTGDDQLWTQTTRLPTRIFALQIDRTRVHEQINARTPVLLDTGGIAEVERLLAQPTALSTTAARAHGVTDVARLLAGEIDRHECEHLLSVRTRQYAKRQDTWLRKLPNTEPIDANRPIAAIAADIEEHLRR